MKYCLRKKKSHVQFTRNSKKKFADVKKVSEILERTHVMKIIGRNNDGRVSCQIQRKFESTLNNFGTSLK